MAAWLHIGLLLGSLLVSQSFCVRIAGDLEPYLSNTSSYFVWHLEVDGFIPGNILYSDENSLRTTNGSHTALINGGSSGYQEGVSRKAQWRTVSAFINFNRSHVLASDQYNHCLRMVDRSSNASSQFVGFCQRMGKADGNFSVARFYEPKGIARFQGRIFLADFRTRLIRVIDTVAKLVYTLSADPQLVWPKGLVVDDAGKSLYVLVNHGILKMNTSGHVHPKAITSLKEGFKDGRLGDSMWDYCTRLTWVDRSTLAVIDSSNIRLRLVDLDKESVSSVCMGKQGFVFGPASTCRLKHPQSVASDGSYLYIGQNRNISRIAISNLITDQPTTTQPGLAQGKLRYEVHYPGVQCSRLTGMAFTLVQNVADKRGQDLAVLCGCAVNTPTTTCSGTELKLVYLTQQTLTRSELQSLKNKIREKQKERGFFWLPVLSAVVPSSAPLMDSEGLTVRAILS